MSHDSVALTPKLANEGVSRRIGLLGGTFDPPHIGHLILANEVLHRRALDEVWLVVANPWQKLDHRQVTPIAVRYELVQAALVGKPGLLASDVEMTMGGVSSTAATLRHLHGLLNSDSSSPPTQFEVIVGSDTLAGLASWKEPEWLAEHATFVAVSRGGQPGLAPLQFPGLAPLQFTVEHVDMPNIAISSTELRRRFATGEPVRFFVPELVRELVESKGLYSSKS